MLELAKNRYVQLVVTALLSATVGIVFYPQKTTETTTSKQYEEQISRLEQENYQKTEDLRTQKDTEIKEHLQHEEELRQKVDTLITDNKNLKQKTSEKTYKIVHPDGTIEERTVKSSELDESETTVTSVKAEFDRKIKDIEDRYKKVHEQLVAEIKTKYEKQIADLKAQKSSETTTTKTTVNEKRFGLEVGMELNKNYYSHITYTVWGPVFIGGQVEGNGSGLDTAGAGLGISF